MNTPQKKNEMDTEDDGSKWQKSTHSRKFYNFF